MRTVLIGSINDESMATCVLESTRDDWVEKSRAFLGRIRLPQHWSNYPFVRYAKCCCSGQSVIRSRSKSVRPQWIAQVHGIRSGRDSPHLHRCARQHHDRRIPDASASGYGLRKERAPLEVVWGNKVVIGGEQARSRPQSTERILQMHLGTHGKIDIHWLVSPGGPPDTSNIAVLIF